MTLKEYLRREQARDPGPPGAIRRLAEAAGLRWQTVQWLAQGKCANAKTETLQRIAAATGHVVSAADLVESIVWKRSRRP